MMRLEILLLSAAVLLQFNYYVEGRITNVTTEGCAVSKTCFKLPPGCKDQSDCTAFLSWIAVTHDGKKYLQIELFGKVQSNKGYVAIGFNKKRDMNDAGVVGCYIESSGSAIQFRGGYNADYANKFVTAPSDFLVTSGPGSEEKLGGYYIGSSRAIVCRIRRLLTPSNDLEKLKDLSAPNLYHVLISVSNSVSSSGFGRHFSDGKAVSSQAFNVEGNVTFVEVSDNLLIKTHGALMMVAWLLCANFGIMMARHMKPMWPNKTLCGKLVWFQIHRAIQILCVLLSIIAFIIIFVSVGGYSQLTTLPGMAHPILGIIVMGLAILNPITAIFRPAPDSANRPFFNWIHYCIGSIAQLFSVATMFIGVKLPKIGAQFSSSDTPFWILVGCVIFIVVMEIAFAVDQHILSKSPTESKSTRLQDLGIQDTSIGDSSRYLHTDGAKREVNQGRRMILVSIYFVGIVGCTIALVVLLFVK